jgi:hypothetical protein
MGSGIGYSSSPPPNPEDEDWGEGYFDGQKCAGRDLDRQERRFLGGLARQSAWENEFLETAGKAAFAFCRLARRESQYYTAVRTCSSEDQTVYVVEIVKLARNQEGEFLVNKQRLIDPSTDEAFERAFLDERVLGKRSREKSPADLVYNPTEVEILDPALLDYVNRCGYGLFGYREEPWL